MKSIQSVAVVTKDQLMIQLEEAKQKVLNGFHTTGETILIPYILMYDNFLIITNNKTGEIVQSNPSILYKLFDCVWNYLCELDHEGFFATPVLAPDYHKVIKDPIDLSIIRLKLDRKSYKTLLRFNADLELMFMNCYIYNEDFSLIFKVAYRN